MTFIANKVSNERVAQELNQILVSPSPSIGLNLMMETGVMSEIMPEFCPMVGMEQSFPHHKPVWGHTLQVVEQIDNTLICRMAGLMHDVGKPATKSVDGNIVHFYQHEYVGARIAYDILKRLRYSNEFVDSVCKLVSLHMRPNFYEVNWTDTSVRRLMRDAGDLLPDLLALSKADITSQRKAKVQARIRVIEHLTNRCEGITLSDSITGFEVKSPINGNELMEYFGKPAGKWITEVKSFLIERVMANELQFDDKDAAFEMAKEFLEV